MVKSGLDFFILKFTKPLQSYCCPVQKNLPRKAELAWQVSRSSVNFKIKRLPLKELTSKTAISKKATSKAATMKKRLTLI
jgi:hypothetical protein